MANVRDIISLCKAGNLKEAYQTANNDLRFDFNNVWAQREMGWVLYYLIKNATEKSDFNGLINSLDRFKYLNLLNGENDAIIYNNVLFVLGRFLKDSIPVNALDANYKLSLLFNNLKIFDFKPSESYSFLLDRFLKFKTWNDFADFIDWWNLDKLREDDFVAFTTKDGNKIMCLAERAYNSKAKALLKLNDIERIKDFLPKLNDLICSHSEMLFPSYFYGKLLLALNSNKDEIISIIRPFAQKKSADFWIWQLFSEIYKNDANMQLACLLRAVNCKTQENFIGKVRINLASLYMQFQDFGRAKFHIDSVFNCYNKNGWKLPPEIYSWIQQPFIMSAIADSTAPIDFMALTNSALYGETKECIAVVTYVDTKNQKFFLVYGHQLKMVQKLKVKFKVNIGSVLRIKYFIDSNNRPKIFNTMKCSLHSDLPYAKKVEGVVQQYSNNKSFAFLKTNSLKCYISPNIMQKYNLNNNDNVRALIVYEYDKKKDSWNWICVKIISNNEKTKSNN